MNQRSAGGHANSDDAQLGDYLRALRKNTPGRPPSQVALARALGVSSQQVSNWESGRQRPPRDRIETYATLFATPRRFPAAGDPVMIKPSSLTPEEQERREALLAEMLSIGTPANSEQEGAAAAETPPAAFWRFPDDGRRIVIIAPRQPVEAISAVEEADPRHPDHQRSLLMADPDAVTEVYGAIRAYNPNSMIDIILSDQVREDDFSGHVIIIGGATVNEYTQWISDQMGLPLTSVGVTNLRERWFEVTPPAGLVAAPPTAEVNADGHWELWAELGNDVTIRTRAPSRVPSLTRDIALIARQPNPLNIQATVTLLYGLYARGTYGAARVFTDRTLSEQNEAYLDGVPLDRTRFWLLFWVNCDRLATTATDATTDLTNPDNVILRSDQ